MRLSGRLVLLEQLWENKRIGMIIFESFPGGKEGNRRRANMHAYACLLSFSPRKIPHPLPPSPPPSDLFSSSHSSSSPSDGQGRKKRQADNYRPAKSSDEETRKRDSQMPTQMCFVLPCLCPLVLHVPNCVLSFPAQKKALIGKLRKWKKVAAHAHSFSSMCVVVARNESGERSGVVGREEA